MLVRTLLILLLSAVVSGCTAPAPTYQHEQRNDAAVIEAPVPNVLRLAAGREAALHFVEVDGVLVRQNLLTGHTRKLELSPGLRKITVGFKSGSMTLSSGQFTTEFEAKPGAHYLFTAEVVGMDYDLSIWDITAGENARTLIKKDRTAIRQVDRIQVLAVPVAK